MSQQISKPNQYLHLKVWKLLPCFWIMKDIMIRYVFSTNGTAIFLYLRLTLQVLFFREARRRLAYRQDETRTRSTSSTERIIHIWALNFGLWQVTLGRAHWYILNRGNILSMPLHSCRIDESGCEYYTARHHLHTLWGCTTKLTSVLEVTKHTIGYEWGEILLHLNFALMVLLTKTRLPWVM